MKRLGIICFFIASIATAQSVTVGTSSGQCGQSVSVPVTIDSVSGMLSLEFRIAYDSARATPGPVTAGSLTSGFSIAANASGGVLHVAMASGTPVSGSGTVATISFNAAADATGDVPLTISGVLANDVPRTGYPGALSLTCVQAPAAPLLVAPANGATGVIPPVTLQWSAAANATSYRVFFGTSSPAPLASATAATSAPIDTAPGTTYIWTVQAVNDGGSTFGQTFTTAAAACATPDAPSLSAPAAVTAGTPFDVSWGAVAGATQYVLEESSAPSFAGATSTIVSATRVTLTRTAPATLWFRVHARNASGACNTDGTLSASAQVRIVPRTRVIPVAGSVAGSFGSFFRTSMQLHNPTSARMTGRLVFHAQGVAGSDGDPSLSYSLQPGETHSYADLIVSFGLAQSIGSLDLVPDGAAAPISAVHVFNDAGAAGTSGMTFDQLGPADVINAGQRGILVAPTDHAKARMNVGIRTLLDGVTMTVTVRDKLGAPILSSQRTYPATYFVQVPLSELAGNAVLLGDEVIDIRVDAGSAIVYGATTDNITQDPSVAIARPVE